MILRQITRLFYLLALLVVLFSPAMAANEETDTLNVVSAPAFPGLSELGARSTQLTDFAEKADDRLLFIADIEELSARLQEWEVKVQELRQKVVTLGNPEEWYVDRLRDYSNQFGLVRKALENIQKDLSGRQQEVEKIRARQKEEKAFWESWGKELKKQDIKVPEDTVKQITDQLALMHANITKTSERLLPLQGQISTIERNVIEELDNFSQALTRLRKATFRKNEHSFFNPEFYAQFGPRLWEELRTGARAALSIDVESMQRVSWAYLLFFLVLILLGRGIPKYRSRFSEAEEWQFVLNHSWAAGSFVAAVIFGYLVPAPPAIVKFSLMIIGVTGATVLAAALIQDRRQTLILSFAAFVLLATTALRLIALPLPLFRIYIALLALAAIPLLIQQILLVKKYRKKKGGSFFSGLLRVGVIVLVLSLGSQMGGYVNFSSWLIQAAFETGMILLFVHMGLRLGNGGIDFLLHLEKVAKRKFLKKYHQELAARLKLFLKIMVGFYAILYLLPVWRVFGSRGAAWDYLAEFALTIGEVRITLQMVGFAIVSLYLALHVSWLLQALCETQVFYRKSVDRGVRDAIKKLVHYGIMLIGFLLALSSLGMSLQNFIVVLGALGVGIGFGLQDIVNNFLSGIILLFERPIKLGDTILVDGEYGTVKFIGLRSTIVETFDQSELIVPNSQMISQKVTNWTLSNRRVRIVVPVGVAYGSDVPLVMSILTEVARVHPEVFADPEPSLLFIAFGESSLDFELRVWIANIDSRLVIKSELLEKIEARFREAGIQIPFPQRDLHLRSIDTGIVDNIKPV